MPDILWAILAAVMCLLVGVLLGILFRKRVAEAKIGSAEQEAKRIVAEALKTSKQRRKNFYLRQRKKYFEQKTKLIAR